MSPDSDVIVNPGEQSVTHWITALRDGDEVAAESLWGFLHTRLTHHAERSVKTAPVVYDKDDVALSAFGALCDGLQKGRYDEIDNRDALWKLLAVITVNKARKRAQKENRLKRGGAFVKITDADSVLDLLVSPEPPPELALSMKEECSRLLDCLQQQELKTVVMLKVEGYNNKEIATVMGCTRRSVQRRLKVVRDIWTEETTDP